jgi:hypothetical protein
MVAGASGLMASDRTNGPPRPVRIDVNVPPPSVLLRNPLPPAASSYPAA